MKIFIFSFLFILPWISPVIAAEQTFEPNGSYNCTGKEDGFIVNVINEHVISVSTGGVEVTYYRVVTKTKDKLEAVSVFDGYKAPINGKWSADLSNKTKITIRPEKKDNNRIQFEGSPVNQSCNK